MGIKELNLEFESEEEGAKASDGALDVDVDLSFSAGGESAPSRSAPKPRPRVAPVKKEAAPSGGNNVRSISGAQPVRANQTTQSNVSANASINNDVAELKSEIDKLRSEIQSIKESSNVALAVAEAEKNLLIEHVSNAKLLDHQVMQMLRSIHKKAPSAAGEVQNIKKYVQEFLQKTNPTKK